MTDLPPTRIIYKNTTIETLDDFYRGDDLNDALRVARGLLEDQSLGAYDVASAWSNGSRLSQEELDGFDEKWLTSGDFGGHDVDGVIRVAYREALRRAGEGADARPIETFWLTGFADTFEIHVHDGKDRVTMFMVLPEENDVRTYGSHNAATQSFVVREGDPEATQTSGA
jgi:hypothetical protein